MESLALMVMRPDDLVEFSRQKYLTPKSLADWGQEEFVQQGLTPQESGLIDRLALMGGRALVLCAGGGREAIAFARLGFEVVAVDFTPAMVARTLAHAARAGFRVSALVQEISRLEMEASSFELAWLSASMYSCVPARVRRIRMLRSIARALKPGGYFCCQFSFDPEMSFSLPGEWLKKAFALASRGNLCYERGDILWRGLEFIHTFTSRDEVAGEFAEGGFALLYFCPPAAGDAAGAVLQRIG
jgi:SAM-dependent methyltransferase